MEVTPEVNAKFAVCRCHLNVLKNVHVYICMDEGTIKKKIVSSLFRAGFQASSHKGTTGLLNLV